MSKVVHPYAHRLVTLRDWKSRWIAGDKKYQEYLRSDVLMREYLVKKLRGSYVSVIEFERSQKATRLIIRTSRPGMIIGRNGEGLQKLRLDIDKLIRKQKLLVATDFKIDLVEVSNPDADAAIVAQGVAEALEKRLPFRRVLKQMVEKVMGAKGVYGVRVVLGGRLGGAEIARSEEIKRGSVPLQTIRADVDFAREKAHMAYGVIGIKVWIYRGEIFSQKDDAKNKSSQAKPI
ncbi:30S ribosomal protein S3 [Candidatus Nomurabacteria bacterium RIFCSPHIGHO2_02_FULL_38_15]|uniref:Small ribosomal subunit protein uS3 n=1 Tax=Candidatus Nomurabacteria bacterium RIFCSPHIGHO2_02_FULL_38_15 TaxID=1801752 RepID=A0A1F6VQQ4_9BACT|nr:MAG: 30S ribosomal protein S3 [Candidatus Nomurabacteria bacterium RIFCSPHIGHO2_02_FULL_38_15]